MWTVLKKELREGWLFLLVNILWLAGIPPVMGLLFPSKWDADVTSIFYAIMFGVFIPLYLVILATGLVQDENTFLVRGLPVKPWKVAGGKLLYLMLNFAVLEGLTVPYMMGPVALPDWLESDLVYIFLWMAATAVAALAAFAFAAFLPRKSYAFFASLLATVLGMGSLLYFTALYNAAVAADRTIHLVLGASFLLLFAGAVALYHDLIRQARHRLVRALAVALLLPIVAGALWMRAPLWLKQIVAGNPDSLQPVGSDLFVSYQRWGHIQDPYLFNASTGDLLPFPFLGRTEKIVGTDPKKGVVFTVVNKPVERDGKEYFRYSSIDPRTGKTSDLGLLLGGGWKHFSGDIVYWLTLESKEYHFRYKHLTLGTTYEFTLPEGAYPSWGPEGVLFETAGPQGPRWEFVDYATATPREAFQWEYYRWPWGEWAGFFLFEGKQNSDGKIPYDRTCFIWDHRSGLLQKLGPGRPIAAQGDDVILIRGKEGEPKSLVLYRQGREISNLPVPFLGGYSLARSWDFDFVVPLGDPLRLVLWSDKERESRSFGTLTVSGENLALTTSPFIAAADRILPIPESDEVLLFVRRNSAKIDWDALCRVYRMDPATGKKRRLV